MTVKLLMVLGMATVVTAFASLPALAQSACLQLNRLKTTQVIDNQTLKGTDWEGKQYTIHMLGKCVGLNKFSEKLTFRRAGGIGDELGCLKDGDILGYSPPGGHVRMQCAIDSLSQDAGPKAGR
jgi:hypothetical protein